MRTGPFLLLTLLLISACGTGNLPQEELTLDAGQPSGRVVSSEILLFEGNSCTQDVVGRTDDSIPQIINFQSTADFKNDETRSLLLVNIAPGIVIRLFDNPDGEQEDDWVQIVMKKQTPDYCLASYEQSFEDDYVEVRYFEHNGLDGKVSRLEVRSPSVMSEIYPTDTPRSVPSDTPLPRVTVRPGPTETPLPSATTFPAGPTFAVGMQKARVVRIIDGDTIEVEIEGSRSRLRYIGMDTPEVGQPYFEESDRANRQLVPVGSTVYLERDVSETDAFDRLLRYVYLPDETFVNGALVAMGVAFAKAYPPDTKHQALLFSLEEQAKAGQVGMWATILYTATPEPAAPAINVIFDRSCSQFDSPGNDNETKDQEYICIANRGSAPVDLTGWRVVDEAGHTYRFRTFSLAAGAKVKVRTGCGIDTQTDVYWCYAQSAIWNNSGDTAYLFDESSQLITKLTY